MTVEKCPCCDFDSYGFGKNIIDKGYGSCEIRLYRATKYDFYIYHIQLELKHFQKIGLKYILKKLDFAQYAEGD